jgi:hypothetical protein
VGEVRSKIGGQVTNSQTHIYVISGIGQKTRLISVIISAKCVYFDCSRISNIFIEVASLIP